MRYISYKNSLSNYHNLHIFFIGNHAVGVICQIGGKLNAGYSRVKSPNSADITKFKQAIAASTVRRFITNYDICMWSDEPQRDQMDIDWGKYTSE